MSLAVQVVPQFGLLTRRYWLETALAVALTKRRLRANPRLEMGTAVCTMVVPLLATRSSVTAKPALADWPSTVTSQDE